jgi:hypothetical protein
VNFCADLETSGMILRLIEESGAGVMNGDCGAKNLESDNCAALVLASLVGKAQRMTNLSKVRDEDFFSISSVAEGRAWLHDHEEWFATCA